MSRDESLANKYYNYNIMARDIWGKAGWKFMHYVSLGYPEHPTASQARDYRSFSDAVGKVLPCPTCSIHYQEGLDKHPLDGSALASQDSLIKWVVDMHNEANKITGKKTWTVNEAMTELAKEYREHNVQGWSGRDWAMVLIGLGVIIWSIGGVRRGRP